MEVCRFSLEIEAVNPKGGGGVGGSKWPTCKAGAFVMKSF